MNSSAQILLTLGGIFLLGMATHVIGKRTLLPRVTLLLLLGILVGQDVLDLIPQSISERFGLIANMALLMVGFLLGGRLTLTSLKQSGRQLLSLSIAAVVGTTIIVTLGLWLVGVPLQIALLLGCIASATAPAASVDIVMESGYQGPFADLLLGIVALDDAWALIIFSLGLAIVSSMNGGGNEGFHLLHAAWDIGGAILLGIIIGLPAAYLTGRLKRGEPILSEALGLVFVCGGLAFWLDVSFLIASMVMGCLVTNLAKHHEYPFHAIEDIEWPIMSLFFILAGASLDFEALWEVGLIGLVYVGSRVIGKLIGANIGARLAHAAPQTRRWMGIALLPQAGAAMGMALVAANQFPQYHQILLTVVIAATVLFEITGPILTRLALKCAAQAS